MRVSNRGVVLEVVQADALKLNVRPYEYERIPHYAALPHGSLTDIWDPAAGVTTHVTSMTVSVEGAGVLVLYHDANVFLTLHFAEKKAWPIHSGGDITFPVNAVLKGLFTADNATDSGYATAFGHEHV
ncbi:hypothetical protein ES708_06181 [subsurface metagenome]